MGDTYSNGLKYPGNTSGPIEEWINCRCSNAPFVMPQGMMAPPGMLQFRESDLIPIEVPEVKDLLQEGETPSAAEITSTDLNGITLLTNEKINQMSFTELADYHGAEYKGIQTYDYDGRKYHTFEQTYNNGKTLTLRFEEGAVKSYSKKGVATP